MVTVQVLDQHNDVKAESDDDGMNLSIVSKIGLFVYRFWLGALREDEKESVNLPASG